MDISRMLVPGEDYVETADNPSGFGQNIVERVKSSLQWKNAYPKEKIPEGFEHFSDYYTDPINFDDIVPVNDTEIPTNEAKRAVAMIVPLNKTFAVLNGPYQWPADHQHSAEQSLLNLNHPDRLSRETLDAAAKLDWQFHTIFVYVKRRKSANRFAAWKRRGFPVPKEEALVENTSTCAATYPSAPVRQLRSLTAAAIEAEIKRCSLELGEEKN
jgi:hypothetical protein